MKKILLVEDDFFIRDVYFNVFIAEGYAIDLASDGLEALEKLKNQQYDLVLLDIMMPKMTGLEVLKQVRSSETPYKDIPVFMITNLGQQNIIDEAFNAGMDGYILKSQVTPEQLVAEINTFFSVKESVGNQPTVPVAKPVESSS